MTKKMGESIGETFYREKFVLIDVEDSVITPKKGKVRVSVEENSKKDHLFWEIDSKSEEFWFEKSTRAKVRTE